MGFLSLREYSEAVTRIIDVENDLALLVEAIVPLKQRLLANPELVPDICFEGLESVAYTRNLLYSDPYGRFSVLALVWAPGRESPVHDHATWGVVGTFARNLQVTDYHAPEAHRGLREKAQHKLNAGDVVAILPPREFNLHKMANPDEHPAISIHTYGDRALACRAFNPVTGFAADVHMKYHHVLTRPIVA